MSDSSLRSLCGLSGLCVKMSSSFLTSPARPGSTLSKPLDEIDGSQSRQRSRTGAEDALSRHGQMGRGCEAEYTRNVPHIESRILCQLSCANHSHEVDHTLQVRRPRRGEMTAQVLAAHADF